MTDDKPRAPMTTEQLAEWMTRELPQTFNVFEKHREIGGQADYNAAWWARGRIDAFLQILGPIDRERADMLDAEWKRVLTGAGFASEDEEGMPSDDEEGTSS